MSEPGAHWMVVTARARVVAMFVIGVVVGVVVGSTTSWVFAPLAGWDLAALTFVAWVWTLIHRMGSHDTATHATRENPGRAVSDVIVLFASVASLGAIGVVVARANSESGTSRDMLAVLAVASVALSWFTVHTLFALRYASLYYHGTDGGVDFNQDAPPPRYLDFAYLSFTIGMTFQVSDTNLTNPRVRATALRHALISYLFGAVILASMINLIVGLGSGKG